MFSGLRILCDAVAQSFSKIMPLVLRHKAPILAMGSTIGISSLVYAVGKYIHNVFYLVSVGVRYALGLTGYPTSSDGYCKYRIKKPLKERKFQKPALLGTVRNLWWR